MAKPLDMEQETQLRVHLEALARQAVELAMTETVWISPFTEQDSVRVIAIGNHMRHTMKMVLKSQLKRAREVCG